MVGRPLALLLLWLGLLAGLAPLQARAEGNLKLAILKAVPDQRPVVGEMVEVIVRAVYDRKIANEKLEIDPTDAFDWIQIRADDWHEEMIDGLPWIVMERRLAIWPKRAGLLHFGPIRHRLIIIDKQSRRQDALVEAQPLALSVGEFPRSAGAEVPPDRWHRLRNWKFTAGALELTDQLSTDAAHLADGETVTRTVTLRALGTLPELLPPRPVVSENWLITFAAPVRRELTLTAAGPVAELVWTWQFRPETGEPGLLEPIEIPYFNTATRRIEAVEIPALAIGYASFYTGRVPTGRIGTGQIWLLAATGLLGLGSGLGLAATRLAPESSRTAWRRCRRWSPLLRLALWRAAHRGDLLAERRLAEAAGAPAERLARIERAIYGRPGTG